MMDYHFDYTNLIQILSGYDTKTSSTILESNLVESGLVPTIVHDKGSYCHGRSNLLFQHPDSCMIYLLHEKRKLDHTLIDVLLKEYPNIFLFHTLDLKNNLFWKEFYLSLQMFYLSKKIAEDKHLELTQPEYNPQLIKTLYSFKGEM